MDRHGHIHSLSPLLWQSEVGASGMSSNSRRGKEQPPVCSPQPTAVQ